MEVVRKPDVGSRASCLQGEFPDFRGSGRAAAPCSALTPEFAARGRKKRSAAHAKQRIDPIAAGAAT